MTYSGKTLSEIKLIHGIWGNYIKGQKLDRRKEKKYKTPPYQDLAASTDLEGDNVSEKKLTKSQIKKRDEIADAISDKEMKDRYGDKNVKYAIATNLVKKEETAIESELTIQDWNVDDIKFTEIETIDIIKPKPLKESHSNWKMELDEGIKRKIIKKLAKKIAKQLGKKKPKITGDVGIKKLGLTKPKITGAIKDVKKYTPPDPITVQNIQTKSVVNQAKKSLELSKKPVKGTTPVKVDVSKLNIDKYFGPSPKKSIKKKFVTQRPTGTFTDDLPKVKRETLIKPKAGDAEKTEKLIRKYEIGDKIEKKYPGRENIKRKNKLYKRLFPESNWREELGLNEEPNWNKGVNVRWNLTPNKKEISLNYNGATIASRKTEKYRAKTKAKSAVNKALLDLNNLDDPARNLPGMKKVDEDWQKVNRNDKTDGLSQKAVDAYKKENPGSNLQTAVTKDPKKLKKGSKDAKRRLAFCRRMKGMKKRLTSAKTARDPDSRINKALRRWNC